MARWDGFGLLGFDVYGMSVYGVNKGGERGELMNS
jgi:hypothetical protein